MSNISFTAHGRCARATYCEPITTGSVGLTVSFAFDAAWSGLQKTAIFRGSGMAVDLVLSGEAATVPPEVLTIPGGDLRVGVWGADPDGNVIIPTVWATVGEIVPGAAPSGFDPQPPAPSWAAQVQEIAREALDNSEAALETANDTAARMTALEDEISGDLERAGEYARQAQEAAANADRDAQTASAAAATAGAAAGSASTAAATATEKAAATARDAAAVQDAADDAGTAKEAAEEAAASVSASAAQIEQNRQDIADQKSAIEQAPTEETGQELLTEEELNTLYTEYFLKTLDRIFSELPQDESLSGIVDELVEENSWLDQLYREVAAAKT